MKNLKILKPAEELANEMVQTGNFEPKMFDFGKLSFKVALFEGVVNDPTKKIFFDPFKVQEHTFCVISE